MMRTIQLVPEGAVRDAAGEGFVAIVPRSHDRMIVGVCRGETLEERIIGRRTVLAAFVMLAMVVDSRRKCDGECSHKGTIIICSHVHTDLLGCVTEILRHKFKVIRNRYATSTYTIDSRRACTSAQRNQATNIHIAQAAVIVCCAVLYSSRTC